jgi:hypothetical protein
VKKTKDIKSTKIIALERVVCWIIVADLCLQGLKDEKGI